MACSRHSKVYLVRHKALDVLRVAKVISGTSAQAERLEREAHLLKDIRHPQIPIIYDIEKQDFDGTNSICIIEEYIDGKTLREYISEQSDVSHNLSIMEICRISIELCNILEYLHNNESAGILHMDLKPDNIMICENRVVLIDFDNACLGESGQIVDNGSPLFAAPEQYEKKEATVQSDVYGLGMVIFFMATGGHISVSGSQSILDIPKCYSSLIHIIEKATKHDSSARYAKVELLRKELECIKNKKNEVCGEVSVVIMVAGLKSGVGTTHTSLCMAHFFGKLGYDCIVFDQSEREGFYFAATEGELDRDGLYRSRGIRILPNYKDRIKIENVKCQVLIVDCGVDFLASEEAIDSVTNIEKTSFRVLVTDGRLTHGRKRMLESEQTNNIWVNLVSGKRFYDFSRSVGAGKNCYRIPCIYEWYEDNPIFDESMREFLQDNIPDLCKVNKKIGIKEFIKKVYENCKYV